MSLDLGGHSPKPPLTSLDELVAYLRSAEKPAGAWRVGVEHEKIGFTRALQPIPYAGEQGIRGLLERLAREERASGERVRNVADADGGAAGAGTEAKADAKNASRSGETSQDPLYAEAGNPIAVLGDQRSVTLEPGGQLELSGAPVRTLAEAKAELDAHFAAVSRAAGPGQKFAMLGYRPFGSTQTAEWMPKLRYGEMRRSLGPQGRLALDMMLMTATVQANLDWSDEQDLAEKSRAATGVSPIVTAIFSNSPIVGGEESGYQDFRYQVWRECDPARCGLLEAMVRPDFGYRAYVEWAVDVPLLFVRHEGGYKSGEGKTFRQWMQDGRLPSLEAPPTLDSWSDHLTTLFPEVRIKKVFELRGADVVPMPLLLALPAIWMGLLYDRGAREDAWLLTSRWSWAERLAFQGEVAKHALQAQAPGGATALSLAKELVAIAARGLGNWARVSGSDERGFLDPARELVEAGHPLSEKLLSKWKSANRDPASLIEGTIAAASPEP